jgi:hypothetical protein
MSNSDFFLWSREQAVERDKSGFEREDAIEPRQQDRPATLGRPAAIGLERPIVFPDQVTDVALGGSVLVGEGVELVYQAFRMHPAQGVQADVELTGVVADHHGIGQEAVGFDAAPQRTFGGNQHRVRVNLQGRDTELIKMGFPGRMIAELSVGMIQKVGDHRTGQRPLAHVGDRLIIDHVIAVAGAQQFEEVEAALGAGGAELGEMVVADLCAKPIGGPVPRSGVVDRDPVGTR